MKSIHENRIADLLQDLRPESLCSTHSLAERMRQLFTPGVSIALIDDFELGWAGGFGTQRRGEENAVSADTLFQAASISKPVFALAVMRLAKSRKIDLDADVNDYLVSWRVPEHRGWQPRVTLRQLLSHTAGMTEHGFAGYPTSEPWPTLTEVLDGIPPANNLPIVVDLLPGLQARYSGGGMIVAQQVVTDVSGRSMPELMRELVLDPLQMTSQHLRAASAGATGSICGGCAYVERCAGSRQLACLSGNGSCRTLVDRPRPWAFGGRTHANPSRGCFDPRS